MNSVKVWGKINPNNKKFLQIYLSNSNHLKKGSLIQYESSIKNFLFWVYFNAGNKDLENINVNDIIEYQNFLVNERKLGIDSVLFKRNVISAFFSFLNTYYTDKFEKVKDIIKMSPLPSSKEYNHIRYLDKKELEILRNVLYENNKLIQLLYLEIQYCTGLKLREIKDLKRDIVNINQNVYGVYPLYICGREKPVYISEFCMNLVNEILSKRNDNLEYIFISNKNGVTSQIHITTFSFWCKDIFSKILKRKIKPSMIYSKNKVKRKNKYNQKLKR